MAQGTSEAIFASGILAILTLVLFLGRELEVLVPLKRLRTLASEPVPGAGLDVPAPQQLLQLDMDLDFLPRLLGGASSISECNWATQTLALSQVGYSRNLWRNDASLANFLLLSSWVPSHVFQDPSSLGFSCSLSSLGSIDTLMDARKPHT